MCSVFSSVALVPFESIEATEADLFKETYPRTGGIHAIGIDPLYHRPACAGIGIC